MLLRDSFYTLTNERLFLLMRCKQVSGERPLWSLFKGKLAEFMSQACMPHALSQRVKSEQQQTID